MHCAERARKPSYPKTLQRRPRRLEWGTHHWSPPCGLRERDFRFGGQARQHPTPVHGDVSEEKRRLESYYTAYIVISVICLAAWLLLTNEIGPRLSERGAQAE